MLDPTTTSTVTASTGVIYARQGTIVFFVPPGSTPPASSVNWWPYSWDATAGFNTMSAVQPSPLQAPIQGPPSASAAALSLAPSLFTSSPFAISTSSENTQSPTSLASSRTSSIAAASATSSFTKTASSPTAISTSTTYATPRSSPFKLWMLAPILGGAALVIMLFVCILCCCRRHRREKNAFEAGPRYESNEDQPFLFDEDTQKGSLLNPYDLREPPRSRPHRGQSRSTRSVVEQAGRTAVSPLDRRSLATTPLSERPDSPSAYSPTSYAVSRATSPTSYPVSRATTIRSPARSNTPGIVDAYNTEQYTSLRRGLVDRIQSQIKREKGYRTIGFDREEEDGTARGFGENIVSGATTRNHSESGVSATSGPGFRIVSDDPPSAGLAADSGKSWLAWTRSWSASDLDIAEKAKHSHFTPKPARRRDRSDKSTTRTPTQRSSATTPTPGSTATTPTRSRPPSRTTVPLALPASPPLVSSPKLEEALSFGRPDPRSARHSQNKSSTSLPYAKKNADQPRRHADRNKELPIPGAVADEREERRRDRRRKEKKTQAPTLPMLGEKQASDVRATMLRPVSPQEREGALRKVNTIVAHGYERQHVASTSPSVNMSTGIQQRLERAG